MTSLEGTAERSPQAPARGRGNKSGFGGQADWPGLVAKVVAIRLAKQEGEAASSARLTAYIEPRCRGCPPSPRAGCSGDRVNCRDRRFPRGLTCLVAGLDRGSRPPAAARRFAQEGANVFVVSRTQEHVRVLVDQLTAAGGSGGVRSRLWRTLPATRRP